MLSEIDILLLLTSGGKNQPLSYAGLSLLSGVGLTQSIAESIGTSALLEKML